MFICQVLLRVYDWEKFKWSGNKIGIAVDITVLHNNIS